MRKQSFISFILLLITVWAFGQKASLSGKVAWKESGKKATETEIILKYTSYKTQVDKNGTFQFNDLPIGNYTVIAFTLGLETTEKIITLQPGKNELNFELDSITEELGEFQLVADRSTGFGLMHMASVDGMDIYAGKKNEVVMLEEISANLATNNSRQIYSRVAGLNIWESSAGGLQLDIGGRGLSPNRTSNFNTRQNGYDIAADALGYPESYYTPPSEAIERIEVTRGAASLQYGTQFGGVLNFKLKGPAEDTSLEIFSRQTIGSYGLFNSFNSVGGTKNKWSYYGFINYKQGEGWRPNSGFQSIAGMAQVGYQFNDKFDIRLEYTKQSYLAQQPGGLTDALFEEDPTQSIRNRNWFAIDWNVGAAILTYTFNPKWRAEMRNFGLIGSRDALGVLGYINRPDPETERDLMRDQYLNVGSETRVMHTYHLLGNPNNLLLGMRYYRGFTKRKQGNGSIESDANFNYKDPENPEYSNYQFPSQNIALFAENVFQVTTNWNITPGIRYEHIITSADGTYRVQNKDLAGNIQLDTTIHDFKENSRSFLIGGIGTSVKVKEKHEFYANIAQNYRAINFNDMRVNNPNLRVDPNLQDERGFSGDIGFRGKVKKFFVYDVSLYFLSYTGRIGTVVGVDERTFRLYRFRTNVSDSRNLGVESFGEVDALGLLTKGKAKTKLSLFANFTWQDARYINSDEPAYNDKKVENVPNMILKTGVNLKWKKFKAGYQFSYNSEQFADATNAEFSPTALFGLIPAYWVMDISTSYQLKRLGFEAGVNNLTNNYYFTRRAEGYPGPGIIPADPINFYAAIKLKL